LTSLAGLMNFAAYSLCLHLKSKGRCELTLAW